MFGNDRVKGKFRVTNTTRKLLAYRVRLGQIDRTAKWEVSGGSCVLRPGLSRQVVIYMPPGEHFQDKVLIEVFQLDSTTLLSLQYMNSQERRQSLRGHKSDATETLTLSKAEEHEEVATMKKHTNKYRCDYCNLAFKYLGSLNIHIRHEHGKEKQYMCDVPGCKHKGSATQVDLNRHSIRVHSEETAIPKEKCPSCEKRFTTKKLLVIHKEANHVLTPCRVEWCPKEFESKKLECKHVKNQHSRDQGKPRTKEDAVPPPCTKCGKELTTTRGMRKHMKNHMNVDTAIGAEVTLGNLDIEGGEQVEEQKTQAEQDKEEQVATEQLGADLGEVNQVCHHPSFSDFFLILWIKEKVASVTK